MVDKLQKARVFHNQCDGCESAHNIKFTRLNNE